MLCLRTGFERKAALKAGLVWCMKKCTICKRPKKKTEFNRNRTKPDGMNNICQVCSRERSRRYYRENTEKHKRATAKIKKEMIEANHAYIIAYLSEHPCMDCGEDEIVVLDFDHVRGTKRLHVSRLVAAGYSLKTVKEEIEKCEVRCANCHRKKTAGQLGSYRLPSSSNG